MIRLDFNKLRELLAQSPFRGLPPETFSRILDLGLQETADRLQASAWFFASVSPSNDLWKNRAYLRAGLSEFRSVKRALEWDLSDAGGYLPLASVNPLIHLMIRLRRPAVYARNPATDSVDRDVPFHIAGEVQTVRTPVLLISDLGGYLARENLRDYDPDDIRQLVTWFDHQQNRFGAPCILELGVFLFAEELRYRMCNEPSA